MGTIFGTQVDLDDPFMGLIDDDETIGEQMATVALDTPPGSLDAFQEYGFEISSVVLRSLDATVLAMLPLEVRNALEQEPAFVSADVVPTTSSTGPGPTVTMTLACSIAAAEGDSVGFSIPMPTT